MQPKTTGQDLVDEVVKSLDIEEKDYFSIFYKEANQKVCACVCVCGCVCVLMNECECDATYDIEGAPSCVEVIPIAS